MNTYFRILRYVRPHGGLFALAIVMMAVWAALDATPVATAPECGTPA